MRGADLEMAGMINALSGLNDSLQFLLSSQPSCLHGPQQNWFSLASQLCYRTWSFTNLYTAVQINSIIFDLHWLTLNYTITIEQCSTFIDLTSQFLRRVLCYSVLPITGGWRWLVYRHPPRPIVIYSWRWSLVRILPIHLIALYVCTSTVEMLRENAKLVN